MEASYKHSYKTGENLLNSLSVYNVGYQKCDPEYQWGPGVRDHYCIHHILSGSGCYCTGTVSKHLEEGDTFILYPGVELRYQADADKPWEYAWAGFMGADAASLIRNTEFSRETPYILKGRIPTEKIRDGLERIASYVGISRSHLFRSFQNYMNRSPKEYLTEYRIKQACRLLRETDLSVSAIAYSVGFENNLYFSKAFRKQKGESPSE